MTRKRFVRGIHARKFVLFFMFILLMSCASMSGVRLEGNDFRKNLVGVWEGKWDSGTYSGKENLTIMTIQGTDLLLTGYAEGGQGPITDEVYGRIEGSQLILTWSHGGSKGRCVEKYVMKRKENNEIILTGTFSCANGAGNVLLNKVE